MTRSRLVTHALPSLALGVVGMLLLARFGRDYARPLPHALAALGVALTACGVPYAVGLLAAPDANALRVRHIAAGAAAAWFAGLLAIAVTRIGLASDSDGFRVLWAPITEEVCKVLMLAALWSPWDDRRPRLAYVTAGVGVGIGFGLRENFVYFGSALGTQDLQLYWIVLRAVSPVLAHAFFGMILGGTMAHRAHQARVVGHAVPRLSIAGALVAMVAHVSYNGVALVAMKNGGARTLQFIDALALVAAIAVVALRRRAIALAAVDEPIITTAIPARDRTTLIVVAVSAALLTPWFLPGAFMHVIRSGFAPLAFALAILAAVGALARVPRVLVPVVVGIALRPLVRTGEIVLDAVAMATHPRTRTARIAFELVGNSVWLAFVAVGAVGVARTRGRVLATVVGAALAGGFVAASLGGTLAIAHSVHPARDFAWVTLSMLPRTIAWGMAAGWIAASSPRFAMLGVATCAIGATGVTELLILVHARWALASIVAAAYLVTTTLAARTLRKSSRA